ncbi:hypothetical protein [Hydrogenophaga sp.]|uniref:hypothetical protein n=1 Tax=Hydrogenophaga sp. TaxID=1904254 RepID=UPI00286DDC62|nr:hypothetical protein [Hydrogenophaga sp.]
MSVEPLPRLSSDDLRALAGQRSRQDCVVCAPLVCPGWESVPSTFHLDQLQPVGTLRGEDAEQATVMEHHPRGTHAWSADAPIAPAFFPYNRCDVWVCGACARPFLRYTEYGGYYEDQRIRALNAALLDDAQP